MKNITLHKKILVLLKHSIFVLFFIFNFSYSSFIDTGYSSRIKSLGDAFCGIADQPETIYYNPAGLNTITSIQVSLSYQLLWMFLTEQDTLNKAFLTASFPIKKFGSIGISYTNFNISNVYQENTAVLTYSKNITNNFYIGLNAKYLALIYSKQDNNPYLFMYGSSISNFAADIGLLYKAQKVAFGVSVFNLNQPNMTLNSELEEKLNMIIKTGLGIRFTEDFILGLDINYDMISSKFSVGTEKVFLNEGISIRAGGNYNTLGSAEASLGFGYKIPVSFGNIHLNYSFSYPITSLSNIIGHHFVNLLIEFTKQRPTLAVQKEPTITPKQPQKQEVAQIKEEITKTLQAQKIKLTVSKEVIKKEDKEVVFNVEISTDIKIVGWQLIIQDSKQRLIKKFYSTQQTQQLTWDLKTEDGSIISVGKYTYYVVGVDDKDNKIQSELKTLIVSEKPKQEEKLPETIICPNCGAEVMKGERFCPVCREPLPKE
mgnify:CR=1 FL=1